MWEYPYNVLIKLVKLEPSIIRGNKIKIIVNQGKITIEIMKNIIVAITENKVFHVKEANNALLHISYKENPDR